MMIDVAYKCRCLSAERTVPVPFRRPDEDVLVWMRYCVEASVYLDHRMTSPDCRESKMEFVKVPLPENAPFIGAKPSVQ